jgi:hypothetical protein
VFLYAAITGKSVLKSIQAVVQGRSPASTPVTSPISGTLPGGSAPAAGWSVATGIPRGKGAYSQAGLAQLWTGNGGPADTADFAARVAIAESGGSATVTSPNPDGGTNVGVWQLDTRGVGAGYSVAELQDANLNTQLTIMATHGGTDWSQWGDPVTAAVGYRYTPGS